MKTEFIDVDGKWGVVFCFDMYRKDARKMRAMMESFGMEDGHIDEAIRTLLYHNNTGMCVSVAGLDMSLVFIGNATSEEQFWDTVCHELYHVQNAICDYYHVPQESEDAAWTMGYLMRKTVQMVAEPCICR